MRNYRDPTANVGRAIEIDQGLRQYMLKVYNYMAGGLGLTGLVAYLLANYFQNVIQTIFTTPLQWIVLLAPLGIVFFLSSRINTISFNTAQTLFWVYAAAIGVSMCSILYHYTGDSIARVFFITASIFASMSLYGYTTEKDLSSFGSFLIMGVFGLIFASIINLFLQSSMMQMLISAIGVLVFTGLTAYDVQKIKEGYFDKDDYETVNKKALLSALSLYLDFLNLFIYLIRFLGVRR